MTFDQKIINAAVEREQEIIKLKEVNRALAAALLKVRDALSRVTYREEIAIIDAALTAAGAA